MAKSSTECSSCRDDSFPPSSLPSESPTIAPINPRKSAQWKSSIDRSNDSHHQQPSVQRRADVESSHRAERRRQARWMKKSPSLRTLKQRIHVYSTRAAASLNGNSLHSTKSTDVETSSVEGDSTTTRRKGSMDQSTHSMF